MTIIAILLLILAGAYLQKVSAEGMQPAKRLPDKATEGQQVEISSAVCDGDKTAKRDCQQDGEGSTETVEDDSVTGGYAPTYKRGDDTVMLTFQKVGERRDYTRDKCPENEKPSTFKLVDWVCTKAKP